MKVKFTTNIDKELLTKIKLVAVEKGLNVNEIIESQLEKYLENDKEEERMLDTYFDKNTLKIMVSESGGDNEYNYEYFAEGFEEWAEDLDITIADTDHLEQYLGECGYKVIEIVEEI